MPPDLNPRSLKKKIKIKKITPGVCQAIPKVLHGIDYNKHNRLRLISANNTIMRIKR